MVNYPPKYCPYCGTKLEAATLEREDHPYCRSCDRQIFHNPVPAANVAVVDGNSILLIKRAIGRTAGDWMIPGGHIETSEQPETAAARELHEETGIIADPNDLEMFHVQTFNAFPGEGKFFISLEYTVPRSLTEGDLKAGTDASDAQFWTPKAFNKSTQSLRETHARRFNSNTLEWVIEKAQYTSHPER